MKNSKIGGRTSNTSHNCSDKKQHLEELQGIQTEDEELLRIEPIELKKEIKLLRKMFRACSTSTSTTSPAMMEIEVKTEPKDKQIIINTEKKYTEEEKDILKKDTK